MVWIYEPSPGDYRSGAPLDTIQTLNVLGTHLISAPQSRLVIDNEIASIHQTDRAYTYVLLPHELIIACRTYVCAALAGYTFTSSKDPPPSMLMKVGPP